MKRILSIIAAGALALLAFSCAKEEEKAVVDTSKATPPVLLSAVVADNVTVQFTPAVFQMGFNEKMATFHTLGMVSVNGKDANVTLSTKVDGTTITLTGKNLTNALKNRGCQPLDEVAVSIVVRASIQDPAKGVTNGFVDSQEKYEFTWTMPEESEQEGCPYEDFTEDSNWSLIGSMEAYGISWDGDLNMWTDGTTHVAAHVTLKAGDEVKFRQDQAWAVNMGGDFGGLDTEFAVAQDGANIKVGADGVYDLYLDPAAGTAWVTAAFDPYPDYTEESNWSVIGSLSLYGISWDGDIPMVSDGSNHAAFAVALDAADEFKFRQDKAWAVNLGGDFAGIGAEIAVSQDGPNIKVGTAGVYDLFVNPDAGTAIVAEASGLKISAKIGGDEPEPEPEPVEVKGWNIIGLNGDWDNDILATEKDNVWTAYITAEAATEFKWRKDAGWDENYGGVMADYNTAFAAVAGGDNIKVAAGFYKVTLDLTNAEAPMITVFNEFTVWSLIGDFNGWGGDVDMVLTDGKWVAEDVQLTPGWKLRKNHGWDDNRGGVFVALGEPFAVTAGGDNIDCGTGKFTVIYDPEAETVTVNEGTVWSLIGNFNSWGGDVDMVEKDGLWIAEAVDLTPGWKIRKNHDWADNRGGVFVSFGEPFEAVANGDNIDCGEGKFNVTYDPANETITITASSYGWSVIGNFNSWGGDVDMVQVAPGIWVSPEVEIADAGWKIRYNHDWAVNCGNPDLNQEGVFMKGIQDGGNIPLTGKFKVVYNANNGTIGTLVWGVVGSIAAIEGFNWNNDVPMNLASDGKWYSVPVTLAEGDQIKIRKYAGWDDNFGGTFAEAETPFEAVAGGDNIKAEGTFMVVYDPEAGTLALSKLYWGLVGEFNSWGAKPDAFMLYEGAGKWAAYNQGITGQWKIRQGSSWDVNCGGTFVEKGTAFDAVSGGDNITIGTEGAFDVIYDSVAGTILVK